MKKIILFCICLLLISSAYADGLAGAQVKKQIPFIFQNKLLQWEEVNGSLQLVELITNCPSEDVGEMCKFYKTKHLFKNKTIIHARPESGVETFIGYFLVGNQEVKEHYTLNEHGEPKLQSLDPTWIPVRPTTFGWILLVTIATGLLIYLFFKNKQDILFFLFITFGDKKKKRKKSFASRILGW